jgi:hypothetical protein
MAGFGNNYVCVIIAFSVYDKNLGEELSKSV